MLETFLTGKIEFPKESLVENFDGYAYDDGDFEDWCDANHIKFIEIGNFDKNIGFLFKEGDKTYFAPSFYQKNRFGSNLVETLINFNEMKQIQNIDKSIKYWLNGDLDLISIIYPTKPTGRCWVSGFKSLGYILKENGKTYFAPEQIFISEGLSEEKINLDEKIEILSINEEAKRWL